MMLLNELQSGNTAMERPIALDILWRGKGTVMHFGHEVSLEALNSDIHFALWATLPQWILRKLPPHRLMEK